MRARPRARTVGPLDRAAPPPASATRGERQLPAPLSPLIGREPELRALVLALSSARLLTLVGAGGVGKTRLAIEAAARAAEGFEWSAWWIDLAGIADPKMVETALIQALDVRPLPGFGELDAAAAFLRDRRALLVLDNCEHLGREPGRVAAALLRACPSLSILATSRAPLGVQGERRRTVAPLSLGPDSDAVRLFVDRAERLRPIPEGCEAAIAEICRRLDGMPLAIELAAARMTALTPEAIARGIVDSLDLLRCGSAGAPERHRTLRASLDWSHDLLDRQPRVLLRRLGVFAGGATPELACEVCASAGLAQHEVLPALETLVEHSLVQVDERGRHTLLATVRQYALERLEEAGELDALRDRHRDAMVALAERQQLDVLTPRQPLAFAVLDAEASNLAAALERALATDPELALRLCLALGFWYRARARFREADSAYARAIAACDASAATQARARAAWAWIAGAWGDFARANELAEDAAGRAHESGDEVAAAEAGIVLANHRFFTDPHGAVGSLRELAAGATDDYVACRAEALLRGVAWFRQDAGACHAGFDELRARLERLGDRETLAWYWFELGAVLYPLGDHGRAAELLARSIDAAAEAGEPTADRAARAHLALIDVASGDAERGRAELQAIHAQTLLHGGSFALPWIEVLTGVAEAACGRLADARTRLTTLVELDAWGAAHARAWAHVELAEVLRLRGEDEPAAARARRAVELAEALGNPWLAARARMTLGWLAADRGAPKEAEGLHQDALATIVEHRLALELPGALEALASVAAGLGADRDAARILGAAGRARADLGFAAWPSQRVAVGALGDWLGGRLGGEAFAAARDAGAELDRAEVVSWLRRGRGTRGRPAHGWESLTPTELEVVRHAAAGLTNPQIGERMFISRATVKTHLSNVYAKLGVRNRSQLAAMAADALRYGPARRDAAPP
jgi:predicted ATPase/DNA-binding CsgD family transcriptional regulator